MKMYLNSLIEQIFKNRGKAISKSTVVTTNIHKFKLIETQYEKLKTYKDAMQFKKHFYEINSLNLIRICICFLVKFNICIASKVIVFNLGI